MAAARTERIEARVDPGSAERIRYASELTRTSMSAFIVAAAAERAEQVIAEHAVTTLADDYFDRLLASLDEAPQLIPAVVRLAKAERVQPRVRRA